jgi:prefoldin subunit 5
LQNHSSNLTTLNTTTESLHSAMAELKKEIEQLKIEKLELKKSNDRLRADLGPRKRKIKGKPNND